MRRASAASATGDTLVSDANVDRAVAEARERGVRLLGQREHSARQLVPLTIVSIRQVIAVFCLKDTLSIQQAPIPVCQSSLICRSFVVVLPSL
jgi:hypothetical protein